MKLWQDTFGQAQSKWQLAGWLLAFAFPVFALVVDKVASTIYAIFFLAGLWLLIRGRHERPDPLLRWVLIAFAAYFLVGVLSFFLGEQTRLGEKILGRDIRLMAAITVCLMLVRLSFPGSLLRTALYLSGFVVGIIAVIQVVLSANMRYRAEGETIAILFGHLCAALMLVNLMCAIRPDQRQRFRFAGGALFSFIAVVLSGTRGAIFAVLLLSVLGSFALYRRFAPRRVAAGMLLLFAVGGGVALDGRLLARLDEMAEEVTEFQKGTVELERLEWPSPPACVTDRAFLQWIIENSKRGGEGKLDVELVPIESTNWSAEDARCNDGYKIVIRNRGSGRSAWLYFPVRSVPPGAAGGGELLAKGEGGIGLGGSTSASRVSIDSGDPVRVRLDGSVPHDGRHLFILAPGTALHVVPIVTIPGEYRFSLMMTSVGSRFLMWDAAADTFLSAPLHGHGTGSFPSLSTRRALSGESPWQIARYDHAHNEILTVAAERGIVGLITLFGVYAAPFWLFWRRRDVFGWAGMAFVASIFISGLTETIFNHSLGITYYCMLVLLLATVPGESPGELENQQPSDKLI